MGGGAWPFLVGGVICLVNSDNERDLNLLNSWVKICLSQIVFRGNLVGKIRFIINFLEGLLAFIANGSLRQ